MNKVDKIRKINNKIVNKNKIDSFERQLINLMNGLYDMNYPMIISNNTKCLNYIDEIDENKILIINPYKVIKINNEHEIGSSFIMNIYDMLSTSLFAMDSITQPTSKVIVLDELDERDGSPIIAICRYDAKRGGFDLNQITSIYGKEKFNSLIINTLNANKKFELNTNYPKNELKEKIEQLARHTGLQLPNCVAYALSKNYDRTCFTKSQVEKDLFIKVQSDNKLTLKEFMNYFNLTYKIIDDNLYFFDSEDTNIETHPPYDIDEIGIANLINDLNGYYEKYIFKDLSLKLAYTHHIDTSNMNYIQMYEYVKTHNLDYYMDIMPYLFGEKKLNIEELNDNIQLEESIDVFEIAKTNEELDIESDLEI
ncbi:hypothetical protein DXA44_07830 [Coprobacillus sp. OF02-11LB]|nr:hypothetical protein DXA44_07830 [Coprobacillus sp. OF02-11LB]